MTQLSGLTVVSCSMKPAPDSSAKSAVRSLCENIVSTMASFNVKSTLLDIREKPLPFFQGLLPSQLDTSGNEWYNIIENSSAILFGVPAYWSAPSSAFINIIDLLCGPAYDLEKPETIFNEKNIGFFVVGADEISAEHGSVVVNNMFTQLNTKQPSKPIIISNPRKIDNWEKINNELTVLAGNLLKQGMQNE